MKKLWKILRMLAKITAALLVVAALLIIWLFTRFFLGPQESDVLQKNAIAAIQQADAATDPVTQLEHLHHAADTYLHCTNMDKAAAMQEALSGILGAYERDFAKHPNISELPKISMIWKSIPSQLAREN